MKKRKKKFLIALIIAILALIIVISTLVIALKARKKAKPQSTVEEDQKIINEVKDYYNNVEGQIVPDNYNFLVRMYEGNVSSNELYRAIYMFVYVGLPNIYDELGENPSDSQISKVYKNNKDNILLYLGIEDEEEFKEFINKTKDTKYDNFQNAVFTFDDYVVDEYTTLDLEIQYANESLHLRISIINQITEGKPDIKFAAK